LVVLNTFSFSLETLTLGPRGEYHESMNWSRCRCGKKSTILTTWPLRPPIIHTFRKSSVKQFLVRRI